MIEPMASFSIWGRIARAAPGEFVVTVSAIPLQSSDIAAAIDRKPMAATVVAPSRQQAEDTRDMMVKALAEQLRDAGHQVLGVEVD